MDAGLTVLASSGLGKMTDESQHRNRILIVLPWSPSLPGGVSVVARNLMREWENSGQSSLVVVSDWYAPVPTVAADGNLHFRFAVLGTPSFRNVVASVFASPIRLWRTWRLLRELKLSSVNFHYPGLSALGVVLLRKLRLFDGRVVLSFHGSDAQAPSSKFEAWLSRRLIRWADGVTACSEFLARQVASAFGVPHSLITTIHNGVDTETFSPNTRVPDADCLDQSRRYIISVGSFLPVKGHRILVEAFGQVAHLFPDLDLLIVGMDGPEKAKLAQQVSASGLHKRVSLQSALPQKDVAILVAQATICIQPSRSEAFGLAVIEAGACGIPIGVSAVGGHIELIKDRESGFLFRVDDVNECAEVIKTMLLQPLAARQAAAVFRKKVLETFSWQHCSESYRKLLEKRSDNAPSG